MSLVYVIEDDPMMADVVALAARSTTFFDDQGKETHPDVLVFNDAVEPISNLGEELPDVILLDVLLSGPDGFTFLNELLSYQDTAKIPVVLITNLDLSGRDLEHYGVIRILDKSEMTPEDIRDAVLAGLEAKMSAPALGMHKLNQQLRALEGEIVEPKPPVAGSTPSVQNGASSSSAKPASNTTPDSASEPHA